MPENTFDVVSLVEMPEVINAIQQALKEITTRFDLKDSHSTIELNEKDKKITLASKDEFKLKAVIEILGQKLVKRKVPLKALSYGPIIPAAGSSVRQEATLQQGIPIEKAREVVKLQHREGGKRRSADSLRALGSGAGGRWPDADPERAPTARAC